MDIPAITNCSRLTTLTYPRGFALTYNYASGLNSDISRLTSITDSSGTLESYDYLGMGAVVRRGHSQPGVDLTYIGTGTGAGGDKYLGLDSFGRVVDQNWDKSGTATDRFSYTYDRDGNRLTKGNSVNTAFNKVYTYDNLNQLSSFNRGSGTHTQSWDYDSLGNWDSVTTNGSAQTRTANKQNEITAVSGATTPTYDANGNMTKDETGKLYVYDAWNRLKIIKDSGGTTLKTYGYDGLFRRVSETASGTTTDLYYSASWQVLEEAVSGTTKSRYVWSPVYVDALILRDRDADGSSGNGLEERLWVQQDANFNVTALINGSGTVVERYAYDSFGKVTYMNASWTTIGSSAYGSQYLHQGGRLDACSGFYYFRNRDYSPTLGRWVTIDPIGYFAGDVDLYRSVSNNPINFRDASGLDDGSKYGSWVLTSIRPENTWTYFPPGGFLPTEYDDFDKHKKNGFFNFIPHNSKLPKDLPDWIPKRKPKPEPGSFGPPVWHPALPDPKVEIIRHPAPKPDDRALQLPNGPIWGPPNKIPHIVDPPLRAKPGIEPRIEPLPGLSVPEPPEKNRVELLPGLSVPEPPEKKRAPAWPGDRPAPKPYPLPGDRPAEQKPAVPDVDGKPS